MLRLYAQFSSVRKTAYQINIYDRDFSGDATQIFIHSPSLDTEGTKDDPFKRIYTTKYEFSIPLRLYEYNETVLEELVSFYTDLSTNPEGRFYIAVRKLLTTGSELLFRGKILADLNDLTLSFHKDLKITAIDGLSDLKSIEYRPTEYSDNQPLYTLKIYSFINHFLNLLKKSETNVFFYEDTSLNGTADVLLYTSPHWTEADQDEGDVWSQLGVRNMWFEQVTPSYRRYTNCYEVLEQILTGFNARLIFAKGIYIVEQLSILDNLTVSRYGYKYNGDPATATPPDKVTHNITTDDESVILAVPSLKNILGLKAVELVQSYKMQNYIGGTEIQWPDSPGAHELGYVLSSGQQMGLALSFQVTMNVPGYQLDVVHLFMVEIEVKIGDYYLKSLANLGNPISEGYDFVNKGTSGALVQVGAFEWTTDPSTIKIVYNSGPTKFYDLSEVQSWIFYAGSTEIPDDGLLEITLQDPKILNFDLSENTTETAKIESVLVLNNSRIIISPSGYGNLSDPPEKFSIYEFGDLKNTKVEKIEFPFFDTSLYVRNAERGIYYINDLVDNVEHTTEWTDPDSSETYELQKLVMRSMLSMRKTPKSTRNIKLHILDKDVVSIDNRFAISGDLDIPLSCKHDMDEDIYSLTLFTIEKDYAGINIVETDDPTIPIPLPPTIITESASIGGRLNIYAAKTITSSNTVNLDGFSDFGPDFIERAVAFYTFDQLYKRFFVSVGGVEQDLIEPDDPLPDLGPGEFTLDQDTNDLVFWHMDTDSKVIIKFFD